MGRSHRSLTRSLRGAPVGRSHRSLRRSPRGAPVGRSHRSLRRSPRGAPVGRSHRSLRRSPRGAPVIVSKGCVATLGRDCWTVRVTTLRDGRGSLRDSGLLRDRWGRPWSIRDSGLLRDRWGRPRSGGACLFSFPEEIAARSAVIVSKGCVATLGRDCWTVRGTTLRDGRGSLRDSGLLRDRWGRPWSLRDSGLLRDRWGRPRSLRDSGLLGDRWGPLRSRRRGQTRAALRVDGS